MRVFLKECENKKRPFIGGVGSRQPVSIEHLLTAEAAQRMLLEMGMTLACVSRSIFVFRITTPPLRRLTFNPRDFQVLHALIEHRIQKGWEVDDTGIDLGLTVCCIPDLPCTGAPDRLPAVISAAFLQAERTGLRGSVFTADDAFLSGLHRNVAVDFALNRALRENKGLTFALQPIYSLISAASRGQRCSWLSPPELGDVSPDEVIAIASKRHDTSARRTMVALAGDFINSVSPAERWDFAHRHQPSAVNFINTEIPNRLAEILRQKGVDPASVTFEITETASVTSRRSCRVHKHPARTGFCFALDDFGTGFAIWLSCWICPSMLSSSTAACSPLARLFQRLVAMLSDMEVSLLIEGVETEEQAKMLESIPGICCAQGYFYASHAARSLLAFMRGQTNKAETTPLFFARKNTAKAVLSSENPPAQGDNPIGVLFKPQKRAGLFGSILPNRRQKTSPLFIMPRTLAPLQKNAKHTTEGEHNPHGTKLSMKFNIMWRGRHLHGDQLCPANVIIWYITQKQARQPFCPMPPSRDFYPRRCWASSSVALVDVYDRKKILIISDLFVAAWGWHFSSQADAGKFPYG
jgi:EAL domain-containing protein (putative c-di-GMP-specific phosphodiesterase class I)